MKKGEFANIASRLERDILAHDDELEQQFDDTFYALFQQHGEKNFPENPGYMVPVAMSLMVGLSVQSCLKAMAICISAEALANKEEARKPFRQMMAVAIKKLERMSSDEVLDSVIAFELQRRAEEAEQEAKADGTQG